MVVAGNETTTKLLANAWYWAWRNPDERAKPFADPAYIPMWVEETLRYDTSSQMLARITTTDVELHDQVDPRGRPGGAARRLGQPRPAGVRRPRPLRPGPPRAAAAAGQLRVRPPLLPGRLAGPARGPGRARGARRGAFGTYDIDPSGIERVHSVNVRGFAAVPTTPSVRPGYTVPEGDR